MKTTLYMWEELLKRGKGGKGRRARVDETSNHGLGYGR
jgi:hypothetical protein